MDCFVKIWQQRLELPLLFSEEQKKYLVSNYKDVQYLCSIKTPAATLSGLLTKSAVVPDPTTKELFEKCCSN
jgi:hypothetical protein